MEEKHIVEFNGYRMSIDALEEMASQLDLFGDDGFKLYEEAMRLYKAGYGHAVEDSPNHRNAVRMVRWLMGMLRRDAQLVARYTRQKKVLVFELQTHMRIARNTDRVNAILKGTLHHGQRTNTRRKR